MPERTRSPRTRSIRAALALSLFAAALIGPSADVARAGDGYWSNTRCWGGHPVYSIYNGQPGAGAHYGSVFSWPRDDGQLIPYQGRAISFHWIAGATHAYYLRQGAECGWFGVLVSGPYRGNPPPPYSGYWYRFTYVPGTCDLRGIITFDNGTIGPYYQPHVYC